MEILILWIVGPPLGIIFGILYGCLLLYVAKRLGLADLLIKYYDWLDATEEKGDESNEY